MRTRRVHELSEAQKLLDTSRHASELDMQPFLDGFEAYSKVHYMTTILPFHPELLLSLHQILASNVCQ